MTTQSLRGMANHGRCTGAAIDRRHRRVAPQHRPERSTQHRDVRRKCGVQEIQRRLPRAGRQRGGTHGRRYAAFTDFMLQVTYPPNPSATRQLAHSAAEGRARLLLHQTPTGKRSHRISSTTATAATCSTRTATRSSAWPSRVSSGQTGATRSKRRPSFSRFRTCVTSIRRSACSARRVLQPSRHDRPGLLAAASVQRRVVPGRPVRGFGFLHDGAIDTVFRFHSSTVFAARTTPTPKALPRTRAASPSSPTRPIQHWPAAAHREHHAARALEAFTLAFDSNSLPSWANKRP